MSQCAYEIFEQAIAAACEQNGKQLTPLEVLSIIQLIYTDVPPSRCTLCQGMTHVDLQTGKLVVKGKNNCRFTNNPK